MSMFGLDEKPAQEASRPAPSLADKVSRLPSMPAPPALPTAATDKLAEEQGFTRRGPYPTPEALEPDANSSDKRRPPRGIRESRRQMCLNPPESVYKRFVAFADKHKLTYHDALKQLLDDAGAE